MLKIYLTSTDGSGNEIRKALHSVSNRDEALAECWAMAQANEKCVKSNGWDTNLMISSQFDWCAALQQIDKTTGETTCSYMWSYEDEESKEEWASRMGKTMEEYAERTKRKETDDALHEVIQSCNEAIRAVEGEDRDRLIDEAYENMLCAHTLWEAE
jgi:hypothetical protein